MDLPERTRIGRIGLAVGDPNHAARFYRRVVGLEPGRQANGRVTFGARGKTLLELRIAPDEPPRPADAAGLFHVAYRVPSRRALASALARTRERWWLTGASDHLVSEALYLDDPEDNGVEIYCDRSRERWEETPDGGVLIDTLPLDLENLEAEREPIDESTAEPERDAAPPVGEVLPETDVVPPETDVGHVHLEVTDLDRARAFYADALGFDVTFRTPGALFVAAGGYHHHIGLNTWNERAEPASGRGLDWFELVLPNRNALEGAFDRLDEAGYAPEEIDGGVAVEDPDGIEVRLAVEKSERSTAE